MIRKNRLQNGLICLTLGSMDPLLLKDTLNQNLAAKGLTLEKLQQQTGVAERYLVAFFEGNREELPPLPYVRGYLFKIASALNLDGPELWRNHHHELVVIRSGASDKLPSNRYALKHVNKSWFVAIGLVALIIFYLVSNTSRFLGKPEISIINPAAETLVTTTNTITLAGTISKNDSLTINGEDVFVDQGGSFTNSYTLEPGLNRIEFTAKRLLGSQVSVVRQIIYQP